MKNNVSLLKLRGAPNEHLLRVYVTESLYVTRRVGVPERMIGSYLDPLNTTKSSSIGRQVFVGADDIRTTGSGHLRDPTH